MSDVSKIKVEEVLYNVKDSQLQAHKIANNPHNINAQTIGLDKVDNLSKDELKEYIEQGIDGDLTKVKQDIEDLQLDVIDLQNADKDKLDLKITDTQSVNSSVIFNKDITVSGSNICGNEDEEIDATKFWNFPDGISIRGKEAMIDAEASAVIAAIEEVECNVTVTDGVAKFFFKLPKGQDNVGPKGEKGSKWISSELLVGTVDFYTTTLNVDIDDWGLNPETGMFYRCTSATTSQQNWSYIGTFQGPQGEKGDTGNEGPKGDDGADGTIFYTSATIEPGEEETQADFIFNDIEDVNLYDYVINTISQVMYKCFSIDEEGNKHFSYSMSLGGMQGQQGERGEKGDQGIQGEPGISPTVTVYSETDDEYILTITDVDNPSGYQTPNLKGENGMNIVPNPEEEGTEDLTKLQIENVVYNVKGGAESGVYVGDTEPTEDNVSLWIDTSEDYPSGGGGGSSSGTMAYSTDEQKLGLKWIDGKEIYQKTYVVTIAGEYDTGLDDIKEVISLEGSCYNGTPDWHSVSYQNDSYKKSIWYRPEINKIFVESSGVGFTKMYITMQYTKNTETSAPTIIKKGGGGSSSSIHKYSTEEQIVGEWIDGKPIYEKIFTSEYGGTGNSWTNMCHKDEDMDRIFSISCPFSSHGHCISGYGRISGDYIQAYMVNTYIPINNLVVVQYTKTTD